MPAELVIKFAPFTPISVETSTVPPFLTVSVLLVPEGPPGVPLALRPILNRGVMRRLFAPVTSTVLFEDEVFPPTTNAVPLYAATTVPPLVTVRLLRSEER